MRQVIVDADACPRAVRAILTQLQPVYGYELVTIASFNHELSGTHHITVGNGPDEADLAVVNRTHAGDIIVTQDYGLASLVLAKGAKAISPKGLVYTNDNIDFLLAERHTQAVYRRQGRHTRGPKARTQDDDATFMAAFKRLLK
jgi:uncharacterized protein YaiI (UPF0178 family)